MKIRERQRKINKTKNWLFEKDQWSLQASNKTDGRRRWHPTPALLPGKSHGRRSLVGCSPWGREESYVTERLHFHFSLSCIGEGNGNPLQDSCLENPRDRGDWWATVYGVSQSWTRLKRLSSSSNKADKDENERKHGIDDITTESAAVGFIITKLPKGKF